MEKVYKFFLLEVFFLVSDVISRVLFFLTNSSDENCS